jgi:hypothetical protein
MISCLEFPSDLLCAFTVTSEAVSFDDESTKNRLQLYISKQIPYKLLFYWGHRACTVRCKSLAGPGGIFSYLFTANNSTEGTAKKNLIWDVLGELPIAPHSSASQVPKQFTSLPKAAHWKFNILGVGVCRYPRHRC